MKGGTYMSNESCCDKTCPLLLNGKEEVRMMMMQAGGMSVILGLVEATQRVSFHPGALLWGRSWTSGLFGGYKARSELPKLVERCMKGVSNLFIYAYKFPYNLDYPPMTIIHQPFCVHLPLNYNSNHMFLHMHHHVWLRLKAS